MEQNETLYLDLTGCKTLLDLHERIRTTFDFPDGYGRNWSAFYDFMCTEVSSCHLVISGIYSVPDDMKASISLMKKVLEAVQAERLKMNDILTYQIVN